MTTSTGQQNIPATCYVGEFPIFVAQSGAGSGYNFFYRINWLTKLVGIMDGHPRVTSVVQNDKGEWQESSSKSSVPAEAVRLANKEFRKRANLALAKSRRIVATNDSHDSATNKSIFVRVLRRRERDYVLEVTRKSHWEGDLQQTIAYEGSYNRVESAIKAAASLCSSQWGDPIFITEHSVEQGVCE